MTKSGAHSFTISNAHNEAIAQLVGFRYQCPHVHVSGRRCGIRVVARAMFCDRHAVCMERYCAECHEMMASFGYDYGVQHG